MAQLLSARYIMIELFSRGFLALVCAIWLFVPPFIREVYSNEWGDHAFPFAETERFSVHAASLILLIATILVPLSMFGVLAWLGGWRKSLMYQEFLILMLGLTLSLLMSILISETIKRTYGRPRPDFLSRCFGNDRKSWPFKHLGEIPPIPDCTESDMTKLRDGRMSFPSEHSATAFGVFIFLGLWLYSKLIFYRVGALRLVAPLVLQLLPVIISMSRTADYRHYLSDVIAGTLIGSLMALLSFRFYFPLTMPPLANVIYEFYQDEEVRISSLPPGGPLEQQTLIKADEDYGENTYVPTSIAYGNATHHARSLGAV